MKTKYLLGYCEMCGDFVQCTTCGNNCCSGEPGNWCLDCPNAYDIQDLYHKDPTSIEFAGRGRTIPLSHLLF